MLSEDDNGTLHINASDPARERVFSNCVNMGRMFEPAARIVTLGATMCLLRSPATNTTIITGVSSGTAKWLGGLQADNG